MAELETPLYDSVFATVEAAQTELTDSFARTLSNGWGSLDSGETWNVSGASASEFEVALGFGRHSMASVNLPRKSYVLYMNADIDERVQVSPTQIATGTSIYVYLLGRVLDTTFNNLYSVRLELKTDGTTVLSLRKRVAGIETQLVSINPGLTYSNFTGFGLRLQIIGNDISAKVWLDTDLEPDPWTLTITDTDLTLAGYLGCQTILGGTNTNSGMQTRWVNFATVPTDPEPTGIATVSFGPQRPGTYWIIEALAVSTSSNIREPTASIYRNGVNPGTLLSSTYSGSNDSDDNVMQKLWPGERIVVQWTHADIGAQATVAYRGTQYTLGRGN